MPDETAFRAMPETVSGLPASFRVATVASKPLKSVLICATLCTKPPYWRNSPLEGSVHRFFRFAQLDSSDNHSIGGGWARGWPDTMDFTEKAQAARVDPSPQARSSVCQRRAKRLPLQLPVDSHFVEAVRHARLVLEEPIDCRFTPHGFANGFCRGGAVDLKQLLMVDFLFLDD